MAIAPPLLIENQDWQSWDMILGRGVEEPLKAKRSLETLGTRLRKDLGLRSDPFSFRRTPTGGLEVRTSGIAGTVSIDGTVIDIAPKFTPQVHGLPEWNASILMLMQYARRQDLAFQKTQHLGVSRHSFIDLLAMAFHDAASAGLADQLIQTYRTTSERLEVLRGRLNVSQQIRSVFVRPHLLECEVDQLDTHNRFNNLLKWAAETFAVAVRSASLKRKLNDIAIRLPGLPDRRVGQQSGRLIPPPQFRVWAEALEIAALLASGLSHTAGRGKHQGYSYVFNMERLFEHFIEMSLGRAISKLRAFGITTQPQVSTPYARPDLGSTIHFYSRPDNVVFELGRPVAIVDAKYKRLSDADGMRNRKPVNADVYELIAAMTAHNCRIGLLVYPRVIGDKILTDHQLRTWTVNSYGTTLRIGALALDLTGLRSHADLDSVDTKLTETLVSLLNIERSQNDAKGTDS